MAKKQITIVATLEITVVFDDDDSIEKEEVVNEVDLLIDDSLNRMTVMTSNSVRIMETSNTTVCVIPSAYDLLADAV